MTKKELVELLNKNFKDDEEVFVKYEDDQGTCVGGVEKIEDVTQKFINLHWEVLDKDGNWTRWNQRYHPSYVLGKDKWREIVDREWVDTKKCIIAK